MNTPAADRKVLVLVAGAVWSIVGLWLIVTAMRWVTPQFDKITAIGLVVGAAVGFVIYRFGFSRLVVVNINRIFSQSPGKDKVCFFSFQNKKSYFMIMIMIGFGYILRHLPIPKSYIAPVYAAIGLALLLSSLLYYRQLRS